MIADAFAIAGYVIFWGAFAALCWATYMALRSK